MRIDVSRALAVMAALAWAVPGSGQRCPSPDLDGERGALLRLVVAVDGPVAGVPDAYGTIGAGVIVGHEASRTGARVVIATAGHVAFGRGGSGDPRPVRVRFAWACAQPVPAVVCSAPAVDPESGPVDVALLCLEASAVPGGGVPALDRLGRLGFSDLVRPVGCPNGLENCWSTGPPDLVFQATPRDLRFTSFQVAAGNSGGAVVNEDWEVVGLLWFEGDGWASALPMDYALRSACAHVSPDGPDCDELRRLGPPRVPRGHYRWTLSGAWIPGGSLPDDHQEGGRIQLAYQVSDLLEVHGAVMRVTPDYLSATGALLGAGLSWKWGRLLLNPFAEVGFARIEGLVDAGGYLVDGGGGPVYRPFLSDFEDDAPGFGVGLTTQFQVVRHLNLEVTVGHWEFSLPSDLPEPMGDGLPLPGFDDVTWAFGFRLGT